MLGKLAGWGAAGAYVHNPGYDQGGSPQAESRPGSLCTHNQNYDQGAYSQTELCSTRELAGWLAELCLYDLGACPALGWLAGWLVGWLAGKAQRVPERPSVERTSLLCAWLEAPEGLCNTHMHALQVAALLVGMLRGGLGRFVNSW